MSTLGSQRPTLPLVRVVQAPHEGTILCRMHLGEVAGGAILAHEGISPQLARFWGHRW